MKYFLSEIKYRINEVLNTSYFDKNIYEAVKDKGYAVLPNFLTGEKLEWAKKYIEENIDSMATWKDAKGSDMRIYGIDGAEPFYAELFNEERLQSVFRKYIDRSKQFGFTLVNRVRAVPDNLGSGGGWHRDTINRRQLKFIIYFNDVDEQGGCFQYLRNSQTPAQKWKINKLLGLPSGEYRYTEDQVQKLENEGYQVDNLLGTAGTMVVVDTSGIHRGKPIEKGERYAATRYLAENDFPNHIKRLLI